MTEPIPKGYKPYLLASLAVTVLSLFALGGTAAMAFAVYADKPTPLWITLVGAASALGVALGFIGLFGLLLLSGYRSFREQRRVQVIPPARE